MMKLTAADGHRFDTFEAGDVNAPRGLVIVQEIFGVNAHMRRVSERLAGFGYRVLCPAFFDRAEPGVKLGYSAEDIQKARAIKEKISDGDALKDIEAAASAFGGRPVGIIGYCWGGTLAWIGATKTHKFKAAVGWYGGGSTADKQDKPNCPVQLHFGEEDTHIPMSDVEAIRQTQPDVEVFTYPGAQHGFGCEDRASYEPRANELAELRSLAFFAQYLR